jgi:hypothetical protein
VPLSGCVARNKYSVTVTVTVHRLIHDQWLGRRSQFPVQLWLITPAPEVLVPDSDDSEFVLRSCVYWFTVYPRCLRVTLSATVHLGKASWPAQIVLLIETLSFSLSLSSKIC